MHMRIPLLKAGIPVSSVRRDTPHPPIPFAMADDTHRLGATIARLHDTMMDMIYVLIVYRHKLVVVARCTFDGRLAPAGQTSH